MKHFEYTAPTSYAEAEEIVKNSKAGTTAVMAGGTDLIGVLKHELLEEYPEKVVALRDIPDTEYIHREDNQVKIGALTRLADIAEAEEIPQELNAVKQAAHSVASPLIRSRATIGGNLCQDVRCWFYRFPDQAGGMLDCMRKGGNECFAIHGENRYHSVFGGMKVHTTPCASECPAGTDIPAYMEEVRKGNWDQAAALLMQYNPMPMLTSRICPHPCQDKCNQCVHGDSVNIHAVERSVGDYVMTHADQFYKAPAEETGKQIAVIGAGPGGLAAAYYLRKAGNRVVVYDRMEKAGGVLQYGIPHYRLPKQIVDEFVDNLRKMGIEFELGKEVGDGKDISVDELLKNYDKLYFGTGAWKQPILGIGGEELTQFGLNFLVDINKYLRKAVEADQKDNVVLVAGGGNVAMDVALTAVRLGAKHVKLVCLEQREEMPASREEVERIEEEGVEIHNGWGLCSIVTNEEGRVTGLKSMRCTSVRNTQGRFDPQYDNDDTQVFDADYIILATGQRVDISFLGRFGDQLKTSRGLIAADPENYRTRNEKIYAGGDAVTGPNIAIRAIRAGRTAARSINHDLGLKEEEKIAVDPVLKFDREGVMKTRANKLPERALGQRTLTDEDTFSFNEASAIAEAHRCMNCGCYSVNASDLSPVMVMTGAVLKTSQGRSLEAEKFFCTKLKAYENLVPGELITEIDIPELSGYHTGYEKLRLRPAIDFAIISLAWGYKMKDGVIDDVHLVLGGVSPTPRPLHNVEAYLKGRKPDEETAQKAAELAAEGAFGIGHNEYKIDEIKVYVKRFVEGIR